MSLWTRGVVTCACALLAGCGGSDPVSIHSPTVSGRDRAACERFLADVPESLAGQKSRTVAPAKALGAAWGDPAITLTCGMSLPPEFTRFSSCVVADGVGWFVPESQQDDESSDVTWTAVSYRPVVRVNVPSDYRPEGAAAVIAELAQPVKDRLELVKPCN